MLSKNKIKFFNSLQRKRIRDEKSLFIAEGEKCVLEILNADIQIQTLVATENWIKNYLSTDNDILEIIPATIEEIKCISNFQSVGEIIIIAKQPEYVFSISSIKNKLSLVLDNIQDPGNMGSIIRSANWFGIETIICSKNSVDIYNPKVIQATMGAICKVNIIYLDLESLFNEVDMPIYGTFIDGKDIYKCKLENEGLIVMGNEGSGISKKITPYITQKITIPAFSNNKIESLNVSTAAAIVCSEFKRRSIL